MLTARSAAPSSLAWLLAAGVVACSSSPSGEGDTNPTATSLASALSSAGATTIIAKNSGSCVDVPGYSATSGAALDQWACNGGANQSFFFSEAADGAYTVKSQSSGMCLRYGTTKGAPVVQEACSGAEDQEWVPTAGAGGDSKLVTKSGSGCLNVSGSSSANGAALITWTCDAEADELFAFTLPSGSPCAAVADVTAAATSTRSVALSWTGSAAATVRVARKTYCGTDGYVTLATLPAGATSYTDTTVQPDWVYWYEITASEDGATASAALATQAASSPTAGCAPGATVQPSGASSTCGAAQDGGAPPPPVDAGSPPPVDAGSPPPPDAGAPTTDAGASPPIVPAFYVATNGSDANAGTLAAPFATFAKAQAAMRASSAIKTTYIRKGSYTLSQTLGLGAADDGETWSYYPPDGVDSASLSGGSTSSTSGLSTVISVGNTRNVTIDGLTLRDFQYAGIDSGGGTSDLLVENSVLFNGYTQTNASNPAGISCYGCANTTISHNVIHDIAQSGVSFSNVNGDISNLLVTGNVFYDTCTANADCGAVYVQDTKAIATNIRLTDNYIHDGNTFAGLGSGYGAALYADDCTSNVTMSGNVITGRNGANTTMTHGGSNVQQRGNLTDLASYAQHVATFQTSGVSACSHAVMSGNEYVNNVVIGGGGGGGFALLSGSPQHAPTIANNDYWSYAGTPISSGSGSYGDTSPLRDNPAVSGWDYEMAASSPVLSAPVSFPRLVGGWGPPGYVLPETGTAPSSPH